MHTLIPIKKPLQLSHCLRWIHAEHLSGETRDAGVEQAVTRLKHLLEKPHQQFFSSLETAEDEREAFYLIAENLLAPLAGECVLKCK